MKISQRDWENYRDKLSKINEKAASLMQDWVDIYGLDDFEKTVAYAYAISTQYGEAAAELACQMYDATALAQGAKVASAEPAETATYDETIAAVRSTYKQNNTIPSVVGRLVKQSAADTTLKNALRDGAEFAWVPSGSECAFCMMLSSRGWQRASKKTIKGDHAEHIHNNCRCEFAIRFDGESDVEGYDPDAAYETYQNAEGSKWSDKVNSMARDIYADNKDTINAQHRAAYAARQIKQDNGTTE